MLTVKHTPPQAIPSRIIPCLDIRDGRIVKGVQFQGLRDAGDPSERALIYEQQGADELVLLDVSATTSERAHALHAVRQVRRTAALPLTVGGGVREVDDAARLLEAGADKVAINTAAVLRPELITELADRFGKQCVVLAIDAARRSTGEYGVQIRAGSEPVALDAESWASAATKLGAGEILLTSVDRDGTQNGFELALLRMVVGSVDVPVIASGGARDANDMADALDAGASAVLAASIFHDGEYTVGDLKKTLIERGYEVRP